MLDRSVTRSLFQVFCAMAIVSADISAEPRPLNGLWSVPHEQVTLRGGFWGKRLETHHEVTIPHALDCLEKAGHVTNFDKAAGAFDGPMCGHHAFDSDIHKALEGALCTLRHRDDPELLRRVDGLIDRILAAQQDDGFLISCYIVENADKRWQNLRLEHQLYNAGRQFRTVRDRGEAADVELLEADGPFGERVEMRRAHR